MIRIGILGPDVELRLPQGLDGGVEAVVEPVDSYSFDIAFMTHLDMDLPDQLRLIRQAWQSDLPGF